MRRTARDRNDLQVRPLIDQPVITMPFNTLPFMELAQRTYLNPQITYPWADVVRGVNVNDCPMAAVGPNTFRAFHRTDKSGRGPKDMFVRYFCDKRDELLTRLADVHDRNQLDAVAECMCAELRTCLAENIRPSQLGAERYNKLRKPVDLFLESLVAMANELTEHRVRLVPLLRVPLDTWILGQQDLFADGVLAQAGAAQAAGFGALVGRDNYIQLQIALCARANELHRTEGQFHPIYFDLLWGNRHMRQGRNLFELNPR